MTADQKLNRVRTGWAEFKRLTDKIEELEALAEKVTPTLSDMPKGGFHSKDDTWAMLADYRDACKEQLHMYLKDCEELEKELNCIKSDAIRTTMKCRYVNKMTIEDIASTTCYNYRTIQKHLAKGRKIYCEVYDDKEPLAS